MARQSYSGAHLSSSQVAAALGVGVSTIKRWTDEGALRSMRTLGGHRRYELNEVAAFARNRGFASPALPDSPLTFTSGTLSDADRSNLLLIALRTCDADGLREALGQLTSEDLDTLVGPTLKRIGELWAEQQWSVEDEHRASYLLAELIDSYRPSPGPGESAPRAILAAPPDELHDLPLRMVRLALERNGWRSDYVGANVPWGALAATAFRDPPALLLLTARSGRPFTQPDFYRLTGVCHERGARVGIGGWWARGGHGKDDQVLRFRSVRGFERWLRSAEAIALISRVDPRRH
jgi:MerR family transcriptional regulator, light-induced transcriptional regulator